ncbi:N-acyl-aromatic-L-amino acid amidohydrolase (carboxylate-forming) isoform X1 [Xenopus laevis]|uniref:N-acyl-aromatic-L-amino acid amidohydrolase (carboxylate-forming) n=3 Tax=Xenopus laevis TaxID=8355 RepID=ACY3_XENLA|nr:N-acyl-aromatic-L-amino acid amidohydrolase (carboxylate-forming) [Xenopus laevis]XP_041437068.1 N-acyl-aromatic-L-amino acid amidohydrolase (carboxylate-forming) isoform X1 [Xenopus laevis]XP_041437069.1 N-acyl-aromatic-L-amino acid amidohydrolase (carboxylate-forming) isoform X1 [Xenopus laevis]A0JMS7.1 RecName: Full=N-acyl-aromatic-L-amino acid amidohydrolase (carboxylate-forming); AltName: Full=Aminoacylase-3; Short=ACY-3; AltName: Full=Aspartoacylase-2 [Xenopus laevis]AAI25991.1 Acy3 pr
MSPPVSQVVVVGGTHGNEMSGVCLAKHWLQDPSELRRKSFTADILLANPIAVERCVRYIDRDLNRSFSHELLSASASESDSYEVKRAREIYQKYGPKQSSLNFVIDLHNTTSNMGTTILLFKGDNFALHLANYLKTKCVDPSFPCHILLIDIPEQGHVHLQSMGKHSISLELGPQPQGVVRTDVLARMKVLVNSSLDFLDLFNQGTEFPSFEAEVHQVLHKADFPRGADGEIQAFIHSELQDKDYLPLKPGDPIFQRLNGDDILYNGEKLIYPVFINESAYYEKKVAFIATEKKHCFVPALKLQN